MEAQGHILEGHDYAKELRATLDRVIRMSTLLKQESEMFKNLIEFGPDDTEAARLNKVQAEIKCIRNFGEISILEKTIAIKTKYFDEYMDDFVKVEAEANERLERLMNIAAKSTKPQVRKILDNRDLAAVLNNREARVHLYKQLKKYV